MKDIIIDENYEGVVKRGYWFEFDGNLIIKLI